MIFHLLLYVSFYLKQNYFLNITQWHTGLFSPQFIYIFYLLILWYSTDFEVHPVLLCHFYKKTVTFSWGSMFILRFSASKWGFFVSYFPWNILTCEWRKELLTLIIPLIVHAVKELRSSRHVTQNLPKVASNMQKTAQL